MNELFDNLDIEPQELAVPAHLRSLPDFDLETLLTFLPDVRLKQRAEALAAEALAVDVKTDGGLQLADVRLGLVRAAVRDIEAGFEEPTSLANQLHKRLTGLRADFCTPARAAIDTVERRIYDEQRRLKALADEDRRKAQAEADRLVREAARKTVEEARKSGVSKEQVEEMREVAKTVVAPPVARREPPPLASSSVVEKWKVRLAGTPAEDEPHPAVKDLTNAQRASLFLLLRAVLDGKAPVSVIKELDWGYLDKRAASERTALALPGLEAYDAGSVRAKPARRS